MANLFERIKNESSLVLDETTNESSSALVEILDSNEKINEDIAKYMQMRRERNNRKNLVNYCGFLDPSAGENESCARLNSIYVTRQGEKSHIKKSVIMNPYGALSQMYQKEMIKAQKKKLIEYSTSYVKPIVKN